GDHRNGGIRARDRRRREPAPPLRAHPRLLGRPLRRALGGDRRDRREPVQRALPAHLAHLPAVVRRDVPLGNGADEPVPGDGQQGQSRRELSDEPALPVFAGRMSDHAGKRARLLADLAAAPPGTRPTVSKPTSNLFRDRAGASGNRVSLAHFDEVIGVDAAAGTVDAEGMITYEALADATLAHGTMPAVVPQLKSITLGGAVAGVGIEASSFRQGLVHDSVVELDVLTGGGAIVTCTADNEHRDLFFGFPNSYGTLGYALRVRARTIPVRRYVAIEHIAHADPAAYFDDL